MNRFQYTLSIFATFLMLCAGGAVYYWLEVRPAATSMVWGGHLQRIAGTGTVGLCDGSADDSLLDDPFGVVIDPKGNIFVSDAGDNNRIRKINAIGITTTLAGSHEGFKDGKGALAAFHTPSGLALDLQGNLIVADTGNNAIRKVTPDGTVSTLTGNGTAGFRDGDAKEALFNGPMGVAVDKAGNIWIADTYNDRIRVLGSDGIVRTVAGGSTGFGDGQGAQARFDTPSAIVLDTTGNALVADTVNDAIRQVRLNGEVTTLIRSDLADDQALLKKPVGLARTPDGYLYATEGFRGRLVQLSPAGLMREVPGVEFSVPAGLAVRRDGAVVVAEQAQHAVFAVTAHPASAASQPDKKPTPAPTPKVVWPVAPQTAWHEIVGTLGEVRGNYEGESRDHFHGGLDVQAPFGEPVLAIHADKVSRPLASWGLGKLNEGLSLGAFRYIHMRVGRNVQDTITDPQRFSTVQGETVARMRVKRGTRFAVGDRLGSVNRMAHVHLEYRPNGAPENPLALQFPEQRDQIAPRIASIRLYDPAGARLIAPKEGRLRVARSGGALTIVVDAFDQMDGNQARRRLGLYALGYQILRSDGSPVAGFENPLRTVEFNRLALDDEAVKLAYAEDSGITVHGSANTRFLYTVSNLVRDGSARLGGWNPAELDTGDYVLRIVASDFAGNRASSATDLVFTVY